MTRQGKATKDISQYDHLDKKRKNNPPVGLVTPATDQDVGKKTYAYDPHLDLALQWAGKAGHASSEVSAIRKLYRFPVFRLDSWLSGIA